MSMASGLDQRPPSTRILQGDQHQSNPQQVNPRSDPASASISHAIPHLAPTSAPPRPGFAPGQVFSAVDATKAPAHVSATDFALPQRQDSHGNDVAKEGAQAAESAAQSGWFAPNQDAASPSGRIPIKENILGDGRIRNPVPAKFQYDLNGKNGNFAVMLMDVKKPVMDTRDLAAKRSSEMTQAAAVQASKSGYQPVKRSKLAFHPDRPEQRHAQAPACSAALELGDTPQKPRPQGPPPERTKSEQARLLTFLRGLNPVVVVDQLCRALAYFGGIPGAPPPPENIFPESDQGNGTGSLFIGWLSEIFPHTDLSSSWLANTEGAAATATGTPTKRPRGRPKGSKSTKVRKDKGLKKGVRVTSDEHPTGDDGTQAPPHPGSQEAPWSQSTHEAHISGFIPSGGGGGGGVEGVGPDSSALSTPSGKKRGRPKGSKNKVKSLGGETQGASSPVSPDPKDQASSNTGLAAIMGSDTNLPQAPQEQSRILDQSDSNIRGFGLEGTLSQHAQNWADPSNQGRHAQHGRDALSGSSPSRKRKAATQFENATSPAVGKQLLQGSSTGSVPSTPQENSTRLPEGQSDRSHKRSRVSQETNKAISPEQVHKSASVQQSNSYEPPSPARSDPKHMMHQQPNHRAPYGQQQQQHSQSQSQPQHQYIQAHQQQSPTHHLTQQSPPLAPRQHSLQGRMSSSLPGHYQAQVLQGQQDASQRPQQSFFRQQAQTQKPAQGQEQQPFSGASARSASQYVQPSSTNSAQNTPTSTTSSMTMPPSTYQNYNTDQAYLNMQYAMSANRAVQVSPRGYGSSSGGENQLGGPMTQPEVPGRMYNSFGRR